MIDQVPFGESDSSECLPSFGPGEDEFVKNPEPRCACLLLLDVSWSMRGPRIAQLNEGLAAFKNELSADSLASKRVEVAVVTFGGQVQTVCEFTTAEFFDPPTLAAGGNTPMGAAILQGIDMVRRRKDMYQTNGITYYRPWIFLITDGGPTDAWSSAGQQVKLGEDKKAFAFFAVGVEQADYKVLQQICTREPLKLKELRFRDLFVWLSASLKSVSQSQPGTPVPLASPTGPSGWAAV